MIIPEELVEKYLLGESTFAEAIQVEIAAKVDPELAERLLVAKRFTKMTDAGKREELPLERMAAKSEDNMCDILCEQFVLDMFYPGERTLFSDAKDEQAFIDGLATPGKDEWIASVSHHLKESESKWLTEKGTALYNIGRILEHNGLSTSRHFSCEISELKEALKRGEAVIAIVNEDLLLDKEGNGIPDHAVCVLDITDESVRLYNPSTERYEDDYPLKDFLQAWETSRRYTVFADKPERKLYNPHPRNLLDEVEVDEDLVDLGEAMAEFAHDIWAEKRLGEGFVYGPENNTDPLKGPKTNKDLKPYSELPESEKEYDREMSMMTLKFVKFLGYNIEKNEGEGYYCPDCGKKIRLEWSYCSNCGRFLEVDDFKKKENN